MAQQTSFVQDSVDRIQSATTNARDRVEEEVQKVQKELTARRKKVEKQLSSRRKKVEQKTRKQVKQLRSDIEKNPVVKELTRLRGEASKRVESTVDTVLGALQIASQSDLKKIDRKLSRISKRLKEIEESGKPGEAPRPVAH
jgi:TolA-binding protein